tara:strand:- start:12 stop:224 length:213 start_codon:yes stop_codon:yes gene_type:complete
MINFILCSIGFCFDVFNEGRVKALEEEVLEVFHSYIKANKNHPPLVNSSHPKEEFLVTKLNEGFDRRIKW